MAVFVRDKAFYKKLLSISLPIALQNLITFGVSMMDTVMLGLLGETALSASSLANQVGFIFMIINFGLSSGMGILTAQYWGKQDTASIRKVMSMAYRISMSVALVFSIAALAFPNQIMMIFSKDPAVIGEGVKYLRIIAFTYVMYGVTLTSLNLLRTVGTVKIAVVVYSISLVVNVFFNWVFIFGNLGAPAMGIRGAALGTLIARAVEFIIAVTYLLKAEKKICFQIKYLFSKIDSHIFSSFIRYSAPVLFNEVLWSVGSSMLSIVMGRIGSEMVAAASISSVVLQFTSVIVQGIGNSAAVITGNTIGMGEYQRARDQSKTFLALSIAFGFVACILLTILKPYVIHFYNVPQATKDIAYQFLTVLSVIAIFQAIGNVNLIGTLRGGGDSKFVLMCDVGSIWLFSVPLGFLTGLVLHWPPVLVFICLRLDDVAKSLAAIFRLASGKWLRDVTNSLPAAK